MMGIYNIEWQMAYTKEQASGAHKRGWPIILSDRILSKICLDICEQFTGRTRDAIKKEYARNGLETKSLVDLETYLRWRIEEIPEKEVKPECSTVQETANKRFWVNPDIDKLKELQNKILSWETRTVPVMVRKMPPPEYNVEKEDWDEPINKKGFTF